MNTGDYKGLEQGVLKHILSRTGKGKSLLVPDYSQLEIKVLADLIKSNKLNRSKTQIQTINSVREKRGFKPL